MDTETEGQISINYIIRKEYLQQCLQFPFNEVQHDKGVHILLQRAMNHILAVPELGKVIEYWMNEERPRLKRTKIAQYNQRNRRRAYIFHKKYCSPSNLWTQILHL